MIRSRVDFDENGPHVGGIRLLTKTALGFAPRSVEDLEKVFADASGAGIDFRRLETALTSIAHCLNNGDLALAAMIATRLPLPAFSAEDLRLAREAEALAKASPDDPKYPGYPAGAPDGKGGQFRPKDAPGSVGAADRAERLKRLAQRKLFRSVLRRVLSVRRIVRAIGLNVGGDLVQDVPIVGDIVGAASLKDDLDLLQAVAEDVADSDAAIDFVKNGPYELGELQKSPDMPQSFNSFDAFKKIEIEKRFGPAGDGYDYHHIVEQGPNASDFSPEQLQSTENIVRIPRLLHEEINSTYASIDSYCGELTTPRLYLRGKSFEEQREFGLNQLRKIGIIR